MNMILILIGILFGLFIVLFVAGIWYGRHHRTKITMQIAGSHALITEVRTEVKQVRAQLLELKRKVGV